MTQTLPIFMLVLLSLLPAGSRQLSFCDVSTLIGLGNHHLEICDKSQGQCDNSVTRPHEHHQAKCPQTCCVGLPEVALSRTAIQNVAPPIKVLRPWDSVALYTHIRWRNECVPLKASPPGCIPPLFSRTLTGQYNI